MSVYDKIYIHDSLYINKVNDQAVSDKQWGYVGHLNQYLDSGQTPQFVGLMIKSFDSVVVIKNQLLSDSYTLTLPKNTGINGQFLCTDGDGLLSWASGSDQSLNMSDSPTFMDLTLSGNLTVRGNTIIIDSSNISISDNVILLNKGEISNGVALGHSGIEICRGTSINKQLLFNEGGSDYNGYWTVGSISGNDIFRLAEIVDPIPSRMNNVLGSVPGYDSAGRMSVESGFNANQVIALNACNSTQLGYVSNMQSVSTTSDVTFNSIVVSNPISDSIEFTSLNNHIVTHGITIFDTLSNITTFLPDNTMSAGRCYTIVLRNAGSCYLYIQTHPGSSDHIEQVSGCKLSVNGQHIRFLSLGNGMWLIL